MRRSPLPVGLRRAAFRSSEAPEFGISARRVRAPDVDHPFFGVSSVGLGDDIRDRCRAFEPLLRSGQVFSHTTALQLHGAPVPDVFQREVHVSVAFPRTPPRVVGTHGHSLRRLEVVFQESLPVATPAGAWCQAAAVLSREDLVAAGDALITGPRAWGGPFRPVSTREQLSAEAARHTGSPGGQRMAWALARLRSGAESRPESLLRLALVKHRLPEPVVAVPITTSIGLLHADLGYLPERVAIEYEGDHHRTDRTTWMRDIQRREAMEDAGWRVVRVTSDDLFRDPRALALRLRHILRNRATLSPPQR